MARLLVGVSGGIAAYKAVELVRLATGDGHAVRVVQTPASLEFVGRATFEGVTGAPVLVGEFERDPARRAYPGESAPAHDPISHLELVRRADVLCVAPASANTLAKLAGGLADNLLTSAALVCTAPVVVAPAMNNHMYEHPATQANLGLLRARGVTVVEPDTGRLASRGEWGWGGWPSLPASSIPSRGCWARPAGRWTVCACWSPPANPGADRLRPLRGQPLVRAHGQALAGEAARRGAEVTVLAANVSLPAPAGVEVVEVHTAAELLDAARARFGEAHVLLMAAAVADFRPGEALDEKISKSGRDGLALQLEPTEDVLAALAAARAPGQTLVGFAAEHGDGAVERGRAKLERKGLDAVVVNDISRPEIGFDAPDNEVTIVTADGERHVPLGAKQAVAAAILDTVEGLRTSSGDASTFEGGL